MKINFYWKESTICIRWNKARAKKKLEIAKEESPFGDDEDAKAKAQESKQELDKKVLIAVHKMIASVK